MGVLGCVTATGQRCGASTCMGTVAPGKPERPPHVRGGARSPQSCGRSLRLEDGVSSMFVSAIFLLHFKTFPTFQAFIRFIFPIFLLV